MKKVAVIILNYKTKNLTLACLRSVKDSHYLNIQIIVVDNNSQDNLGESLKDDKNVLFIQNSENLGYSGANNVGINKALENKADFIFLLNSDTTIKSSCIDSLIRASEDQAVGILAPKILFSDKKTIWYAGGIFDSANVIGQHRGVNEQDHGQYNQTENTDYASGGAIFIRREIIEEIGLLDEQYFLYYEDSDYCFRARQAGYKILYVPQAVVYHINAQSTGLGSSLQDYYITRNRLYFAAKFLTFRTKFALFREAFKNIAISTKRQALFDFLSGKMGRGNIK